MIGGGRGDIEPMSEGNQGSEPKRPGSSWHAWVSPTPASASPALDPEPAEEAPLTSTEMGEPGVPLALLPAIAARLERLEAMLTRLERVEAGLDRLQRVEAAFDRLFADIGALATSTERSSATVTGQIEEQGSAFREQVGGQSEAIAARLDALRSGFAGPLGELGALLSTRLDGLGLDFAELLEALTESVDAIASAPAPPAPVVDLAPIEELQRSVDALVDEVRATTDALPPPAPAPVRAPGADDTARLLMAAEELAAQVASVQDEVTQLKRRVGVRAKVPIVLDDAQMDDLADRVASHLERTFEISE
jgi:hypothetical protein